MSQVKILLKNRKNNEELDILNAAIISSNLTYHNDWNGGTDHYTIYIFVSIKLYSGLSNDKKETYCQIIRDAINEIETDDSYDFSCRIEPKFSSADLDWDSVGGIDAYNKCKSCLAQMKQLLIDVATNTIILKGSSYDNEYINLYKDLTTYLNKLSYNFNGLFISLWEWNRYYKDVNNNLSTYQSRRVYIDDLFHKTEILLKDGPQNVISETVTIDDWEDIERRMVKIKQAVAIASDIEDYQSVGLRCREIIISIAKTVYNPTIHGERSDDGSVIGECDAVRQLSNYFMTTLKGKENEELRAYAKATNKMANALTHRNTSTKTEMLLCVNATVALINFVGILEGKTWSY